jgi:hypothetical protein
MALAPSDRAPQRSVKNTGPKAFGPKASVAECTALPLLEPRLTAFTSSL